MADTFTNPDSAMISGQNSGRGNVVDFPQPWLDYASAVMPNSLTLVLRWAEYIWNSNGTYRSACSRVARYFITDLIVKDTDDDNSQDVKDLYEEEYKYRSLLAEIGDNYIGYGNVFLYMWRPFNRYLSCKCGRTVPFDRAADQKMYDWQEFEFKKVQGACSCGDMSPWTVHDTHSDDPKDLKVRILNPHELEIAYDPLSGDREYYWNVNAYLDSGVRTGVPILLKNIPLEVLQAIKDGTKRFKFDTSSLFHAYEPAPSGLYTGGWGIPRVISNFRLAFHYQVLNRFDQAIAMDYINGMRVISPSQGNNVNGSGDPLVGGSSFSAAIQNMVATHRRDPNSWQIAPIPLEYQLFGGEGQQLSPKDLMKLKLDEWLDATGIPAELYHGSLTTQSAPVAVRIFESSWPEIPALYKQVLKWVSKYIIDNLKTPEFNISMARTKWADDLDSKALVMQLMAGNQVSQQTALEKLLGITDYRAEIQKVYEAQQIAAEEEKKFQEKMQQLADTEQIKAEWAAKSQAAGGAGPGMPPGGPAPGGAPMDPGMGPGGPGGGLTPNQDALSTPESMQAEADRLAQQIIAMGDGSPRRKALLDLRKTNETLADLVKGKIQKYEQQAGQSGVQALRGGQMAPGA